MKTRKININNKTKSVHVNSISTIRSITISQKFTIINILAARRPIYKYLKYPRFKRFEIFYLRNVQRNNDNSRPLYLRRARWISIDRKSRINESLCYGSRASRSRILQCSWIYNPPFVTLIQNLRDDNARRSITREHSITPRRGAAYHFHEIDIGLQSAILSINVPEAPPFDSFTLLNLAAVAVKFRVRR